MAMLLDFGGSVARLRLKCNVARLMWRCCCWIEVAVLLG